MNKLMTVVVASVCAASLSAVAAEDPSKTEKSEAVETEEEETALFEAGFDVDLMSAYVWRNAVQTDRMVLQPCVWADFTALDPFWVGFSIWQNYDLSHHRGEIYRYGCNETDYNIHAGVTPWTSEDEEYSLDLELGHDWYTYHGVRDDARDAYPNTSEIYVKGTFNNPLVNVYGQASWMYGDYGDYKQGLYYELGLNKEVEVLENVTLGADWNVGFGDGHYLDFLYGTTSNPYFDEDAGAPADDFDCGSKPNIAGTTLKTYLKWQITENLSVGGTLAYTGVLSGPHREAFGEQGDGYGFHVDGENYPRDLLWGGLSLNLAF